MRSPVIIRIEQERLVPQSIKAARRTIANGEVGMGKIDRPALRENATQQHAQDVVRSEILNDVIDILTVTIDRREDVARRQDENLPHLVLALLSAHPSEILRSTYRLGHVVLGILGVHDVNGTTLGLNLKLLGLLAAMLTHESPLCAQMRLYD